MIPVENTLTLRPTEFLNDVIRGLSSRQKYIPSKYFYDEKGSELFDRITKIAEYYPTRTEEAIMVRHIDEIVSRIGSRVLLVELGSGSSNKTRILLRHLQSLAAYVPIDISSDYLESVALELRSMHPNIKIEPVAADYTKEVRLPIEHLEHSHIVAYFPGSTIGNFKPEEAVGFLKRIRNLTGVSGGLLIGVDLVKDQSVLNAAYNDSEGITAAFNLNLLVRINSELGADFDIGRFGHRAFFNAKESRIEMHLVSEEAQTVTIDDHTFDFDEGEYIYTESSYKYTVESFGHLAAEAGFRTNQVWTDDLNYFSIHYLESYLGSSE